MSTTPAAGWYSDPGNPGGALRWWDGTQWTAHTEPVSSAAPPSVAPYGSPATSAGQADGQPMTYGQSHSEPMPGAPMSYGQGPGQYSQQPSQFPQPQTPFYGAGMGRPGYMRGGVGGTAGSTFARRNQASLTATAATVVYVVLALSTHIVALGILPAIMCMRAFQRKEPLAPLALLAAVVAIGMAVAFIHV